MFAAPLWTNARCLDVVWRVIEIAFKQEFYHVFEEVFFSKLELDEVRFRFLQHSHWQFVHTYALGTYLEIAAGLLKEFRLWANDHLVRFDLFSTGQLERQVCKFPRYAPFRESRSAPELSVSTSCDINARTLSNLLDVALEP